MIRSTWQFRAPFLFSLLLLPELGSQDTPDRPDPVIVRLDTMLGADVVSAKGERLGKIDDLVVDPMSGRIDEMVLAVAKALELGDRKVLIRWSRVTWDAEHKSCRHDANREDLQQAGQTPPKPPRRPPGRSSLLRKARHALQSRPPGSDRCGRIGSTVYE